jgi:hypothetical protein
VIVDEIVSGVLGYLSDLIVEPCGGWVEVVNSVAISSDKHALESELNVEEVQGLLNLVNHGVGINDLLRNGDTSLNEHVEDSGGSCGINAIVECLWFGCGVETKQAKNNWVSRMLIEGVPQCNISVVESLREEIAALEVGKLSDEWSCKTEQVLESLISPDQLVVVDCVRVRGRYGVGSLVVGKGHEGGSGAGTETDFGGSLGHEQHWESDYWFHLFKEGILII